MSKRAADIVISTPASKVRRRLNFGSPYTSRAAAPIVRVTKQQAWTNRPMNRKPRMYRMYRSPDVPRGCEGPCKVQSFESRHDIQHIGKVMCISDVTRGTGLTHRVGKRFCVKSVYVLGKIWMDENIKTKNHTNSVMFFLVRDRRPVDKPQDFGEVFNMFDNEPSTATVKNVHRDRYQVLRKWYATVTGGQYASKEQALVKKFVKKLITLCVTITRCKKYENHTENALMLIWLVLTLANPVYATLKIRIYFYDSVTN
ncbi:coat protein [Cotton leaf curl virus]|uniref:coat protein n=1 Tax=Cotton leaf curl virus TaxID=53010 RepID=UPI0004E05E45|nr:coat protein [Cotton leaf curl virus]AIH07512.1 coat protein [Cotton leaf curl Rajasthan virus]WKK44104.1 coat protein [Cotton leaf curl Multan virus]AIH07533.1 coat protein [Cotton leaf curl Rajasthan virus]AOW71912.1 coat protein [Cotton leaf curl virus]ARR96938.1 AV2 [Cotton leaf curl Rajasthan virus]